MQISPSVSSSFNVKSSNQIQFFVRLLPGKTLAIRAYPTDTVEVIHDKITLITGIPKSNQRLIYGGKQLQFDQKVSDYGIEKEAELHLVGRLRSTRHPQAWQLMNDLCSLIFDFCKSKYHLFLSDLDHIISVFTEFLSMTPNDFDQASEYLEIFINSSVPAALVMLYMSRNLIANEWIREIISSLKTKSVTSIHSTYAIYIIVLEFCKILGKAVEIEDNLYIFCRSSLGAIIESIGIASCKADTKKLVSLQDIFPFVYQIAAQLYVELESTMKSTDFSLSVRLVGDFTAFMLPVRNVIRLQVLFGFPIAFPLVENDTGEAQYYRESIEWLHKFFYGLLEKIVFSLRLLEDRWGLKEGREDRQVVQTWWSLYLTILKELNNISKLYTGMENVFWQKMREVKVSLCFLIVKFANKSEDYGWLIEHQEVTNFKIRRHLAMMMLPEVGDNEELFYMLIDRSQLLEESFEYIGNASPKNLRGRLFMEFKYEAATGPGVMREWFSLVCQAIFNPQNALFVACPDDRKRFFPNLASKVNSLHLKYFCFCGRMIALALKHKVQIGVVFDRTFFLQLAGKNISLEDIRDADPCLYNSWKQILAMDPETVDQDILGLRFFCEAESLGSRKGIELCPNGKDTVVDSKNREKYVNLLIKHHFVTSIAEQVACFAKGFADITTTSSPRSFFRCLNLEDLNLMLDGNGSDVSVEDWKAHTDYYGYKKDDRQISWFWKIVGSMSVEQRKVLLFFWTSTKSLPLNGFGGLDSRLYIYKNSKPSDHLPSSQTCFYRICFPPYKSKSIMQDRLRIITQEHVGCSFGSS